MFKVKATQLGYYGHKRRREGEVFEIRKAEHFSKKWMVKVGKAAETKIQEEDNFRDEVPIAAGSKAQNTGKIEDNKGKDVDLDEKEPEGPEGSNAGEKGQDPVSDPEDGDFDSDEDSKDTNVTEENSGTPTGDAKVI